LSERGDVIKTQARVIYVYDMHIRMHTTQSLFLQMFLANSALAAE